MYPRRFFTYQNKKIAFSIKGEGQPIVLLHGYLETMDTWKSFGSKLSEKFRVITIDLPGHGESEVIKPVHTMELMAEVVFALLLHLEIYHIYLIGHSMGGYVSLAFAEKYPEMLKGFSLFHSHPFADSEETRKNRNREIELVRLGKKETIIQMNVQNGFAEKNRKRFRNEIDEFKSIAVQNKDEGIIANLEGMKKRKDRSGFLSAIKIPFLLIAGQNDFYIPLSKTNQIDLPKNGYLYILENSGHMGFVEEPEKSADILDRFINNT